MITQALGAIINIIMDPIMIFGLIGFPKLGMSGAAIATVIGQSCAAVTGLILNLKTNKDIQLSIRKIFSPVASTIKNIYFVGVPSILMISIGSVMTYFMSIILGGFSYIAQAVFGAYFKIQSFFFLPVFGLNNGVIPVLAYNYGARKRERIMEALKFAVILAFVMMSAGTVTMLLIPKLLLMAFKATPEMLAIGIPALRIISLHFPLAGIAIVLGSVFQAFSKSYFSLIISLARQLIVLLPVAWLLSLTGVLQNIWWAFIISEVASLTLTAVFFKYVKRTVVDEL